MQPAGTPSPNRTVAVGFDGSSQACDALVLGAQLARLLEARLAVVVVYPVDFLVDLDLEEYRHLLEEDAEGRFAEAPQSVLRGLAVELHTAVARSDARGLHDAADDLEASILVVGSSHRSVAGRALLGSVGTRLLHGAPCAVAVAPGGYATSEEHDLRVVAAAYDGSSEARTAVIEAAGLAAAAEATLRIVAVADTASTGSAVAIAWATYDASLAEQKAFLEKELDALVAELPDDLRAETHVATGNPAKTIRDETAKGVDLLVVGSRGYGALRRVMLGSVSAELIRTAPCPVLVTPQGTVAP